MCNRILLLCTTTHMVVLKTLLWVLSSWLLCFWEQKRREEVVLRLLCSVSVHREPLWKQHVVPRSKESWQRIIEGKNYSIIKNFCLKKPFLEKFRRFMFKVKTEIFCLFFQVVTRDFLRGKVELSKWSLGVQPPTLLRFL